jgi:hypothetical protein
MYNWLDTYFWNRVSLALLCVLVIVLIAVLCSCLYDIPLAWIHDLFKKQAEEVASQLGLSTDGKLDDLRKRVKEKWTAIEDYLLLNVQLILIWLRSLILKLLKLKIARVPI